MANCQYNEIGNISESNIIKKTDQRKPFLRQLFVCSGGWASMFLYGFAIGGPTVYIPQMRKEANSTNDITDNVASWLSASNSISSIPFMIIVPIVGNLIGRKITLIIGAIALWIGHIVLYFSSNVFHVLISQAIQGLSSATQIIILVQIFTEYTSPKYRGQFLIIKMTAVAWGIWVVNAIGTFFHWKLIPLAGIVCSVYVILIAVMSPESPYWLAVKGKFQECATSHRWLKGSDEESEKELESLLNLHKEYNAKDHNQQKNSCKGLIKSSWNTIKSKEFYKPSLIALTTVSLSYLSGKSLCVVYALDILKQITNSESTAYIGMLILDGVTVFSMFLGYILVKLVRRRSLLLVGSSIGAMCLIILSLYLYIIKLGIIIENKYVSLVLLSAYSVAESCGPWAAGHAFYGELIPLKSRGLSLCLIYLTLKLFHSTLLKTAPLIFKSLGLHGFFLLFGFLSFILISVLYKYLPETKDKTLQEIAHSINGVNKKKRDENEENSRSLHSKKSFDYYNK